MLLFFAKPLPPLCCIITKFSYKKLSHFNMDNKCSISSKGNNKNTD